MSDDPKVTFSRTRYFVDGKIHEQIDIVRCWNADSNMPIYGHGKAADEDKIKYPQEWLMFQLKEGDWNEELSIDEVK